MSSVAGRHAEWLSLLEINGPFLSMSVLLKAFPQGLDAHDSEHAQLLRAYYDEWHENQESHRPDAAIHHAWINFVLKETLGFTDDLLLTGQQIPENLSVFVALENETLRPDLVLVNPAGSTDAGTPRLLIQILPASQGVEKSMENHRWKASPASRMLELLKATNTRVGLVTNGEPWMLINAPQGESTGYITWTADLWVDEPTTLQAFRSLLSLRRFFGVDESQTIESLLDESLADQQEVTDQLGYQVRKAVEVFIQAFDRIDQDRNRELLNGVSATFLYEAALTVMMRLVFLLSAEERGLFMLGEEMYDQHYAVSTLRAQLRETADQQGEEVLSRRSDAWCRLLATFRAVYGGVEHDALRLPAYGGNLFDPDRFPFLEGRAFETSWRDTNADPLPISNQIILHLLEALQILKVKVPGGQPEPHRLSFSTLGVEQIGHVYEGLLDHIAVRATSQVLGLAGSKDQESAVALEDLERLKKRGEKDLVDQLKKITGRQASTLKKALDAGADEQGLDDHLATQRLLQACNNDAVLCDRVRPWAKLLRRDSMDFPVVINSGSLYVTRGDDRRSTGTHYTPPTLTEPIVRQTLEPLAYIGPAEGAPGTKWKLRSAKEILDLKVCDMAMGSGAFLVQACRYLAEKLVEAWEDAEAKNPGAFIVTPEGGLSTGLEEERLLPADVNERILIARRYVADRCLFGVDKNPLAVEMAKLSLWLVTLRRDRPFTFLDHAFKCGDSLLGVSTFSEIENFSLREGDQQITFATSNLFRYVEEAVAKRQELEQLPSDASEQIETKSNLHAAAEAATTKVKALADLLIAFELCGFEGKQYDMKRTIAANHAEVAMRKSLPDFQASARDQLRGRRPFHWPLEFPDVFVSGGFDAFVGNPPFMASRNFQRNLGDDYSGFLIRRHSGSGGQADLCAYFFRAAWKLKRTDGTIGLLATNSISEGDTRAAALDFIIESGGRIYAAKKSFPWPGGASLHVSSVHCCSNHLLIESSLDGSSVAAIDTTLSAVAGVAKPFPLPSGLDVAFKGTGLGGDWFVITHGEMETFSATLIRDGVVKPYVTGQDLVSLSGIEPDKLCVDFPDLDASELEKRYPDLWKFVKQRAAASLGAAAGNARWWRHRRSAGQLYRRILALKVAGVVVKAQTGKAWAFVSVPGSWLFDQTVIVFVSQRKGVFSFVKSTLHEAWVDRYSSTHETRLRYSPSDVFENFPQPASSPTSEQIGRKYQDYRSQLMRARQEGLTKTYNRFHDPGEKAEDIARLRVLHREMDNSVACAYGWSNMDLGHGFHETRQGVRFTINESARSEVLDRLLQLNHEFYAEEVRLGLHDKKHGKDRKKKSFAGGEAAEGELVKPQLFE
jgi:hypothetical protein